MCLLLLQAWGVYLAAAKLPHAVWALVTLGETKTHLEKVGKIYRQVNGHHSIYLMVEGLIYVLLAAVVACIYVLNVKDAYHCGKLREEGGRLHTFKQTLQYVADYRFPQLAVAIPLLGVLFFTVMPIVFMICLRLPTLPAATCRPPIWSIGTASKRSTIFSGSACFFGGFAVALVVSQHDIRFKKFWRTVFILPYTIPMFVSALILRNVFNGQFGPVNQYLSLMGISKIPWLSDPVWAKFTLILVNFLLGFPVVMLMIIGILSTVPRDMYEAADIDGAGAFQKLRSITFPSSCIRWRRC